MATMRELTPELDARLRAFGISDRPNIGDEEKAAAIEALSDFEAGIRKALAVSKDLRDGPRAERQWDILYAVKAKFDGALAKIGTGHEKLFAEIVGQLDALRLGDVPTSDAGKLLQFMQRAESRAALAPMTSAERFKLALEHAQLGDLEPVRAARGGLVPLMSETACDRAEGVYLVAVAPDAVQQGRIVAAALKSLRLFKYFVEHTADKMLAGEKGILPEPPKKAPNADMTDRERVDFIKAHGLAAYNAMQTVKRPRGPEPLPFPPGTKFLDPDHTPGPELETLFQQPPAGGEAA